jgi:hypothetical protein
MGATGAAGLSALHGGTIANRIGESGFRDFVHGTSETSANNIVSGGVRAVSTNTAPFPTGSFFTFEVNQANAEIAASHFALRHTSSANARLLVGRVPTSVLNDLRAREVVRTGPTPGLPFFPHQTVFLPEAFETLNVHIVWTLKTATF